MLRNLLFVAIALVLILLVSSTIGFITYRRRQGRLQKIAQARTGTDSWAHFSADFSGWSQDRLRRLYDDLLLLVGYQGFPLLPDDRLLEDLDIDDGNLVDFLELQVRALGGDYDEVIEKSDRQPFHTVRDMIKWIAQATHIDDIEESQDGPR